MTAITREYLDALRLQALDRPHYVNPREVADLIAALRRVLDLCDEVEARYVRQGIIGSARVRAAIAGTQTDDGYEFPPADYYDPPAPSSPDRIDGWAQRPQRPRYDRGRSRVVTADAARKPCQGCGTPGSPGMPQAIHCGHCPPWTCNHCGRIDSLAAPCGCWVTFDGLPLADIKGHLAALDLSVGGNR